MITATRGGGERMTMNKGFENLAVAMDLLEIELDPRIPLDFIVENIKFRIVYNF